VALVHSFEFAPAIQESLMSPGFTGLTLNYQERRIYHWHEELDRRIGADRFQDPGTVRKGPNGKPVAPQVLLQELLQFQVVIDD
jgi:hypothetical protein